MGIFNFIWEETEAEAVLPKKTNQFLHGYKQELDIGTFFILGILP